LQNVVWETTMAATSHFGNHFMPLGSARVGSFKWSHRILPIRLSSPQGSLVGGWALPLWNIWLRLSSSVGIMTIPTEWKNKIQDPNHQPVPWAFQIVEILEWLPLAGFSPLQLKRPATYFAWLGTKHSRCCRGITRYTHGQNSFVATTAHNHSWRSHINIRNTQEWKKHLT
jgi:hypothetical protein